MLQSQRGLEPMIPSTEENESGSDRESVNENSICVYSKEILRFAYRLLQDEHAAEDILQVALLAGMDFVKKYPEKSQSDLRKWMYVAARRRCFNYRRDAARWRYEPLDIALHSPKLTIPTSDSPLGPSEESESDESCNSIRSALGSLSEKHRSVLALLPEASSYAEIAEILGIEITTLKNRIHRAREAFKKALKSVDPLLAAALEARSNSKLSG
ncbi:MAG: RNA polymerase sigma factor [Fimbriiglobus sp.]